jgi:DNA-binding LytR/AlgR family response regulator
MGKPKAIFYKFKLSLPWRSKRILFEYKDILFIKAENGYAIMFVAGKSNAYDCYDSLDELERKMPHIFFRCHRAYMVNLCKIDSIGNSFIVVGENKIPVSREKRLMIVDAFKDLHRISYPLCTQCQSCDEQEQCTEIRPFIAM